MRFGKGVLLMTGLVALVGCSSLKHSDSYIKQPTVCVDKKWYGYHQGTGCPSITKVVAPDASQEMAARLAALERDRQRMADELEAARHQNGALSGRVSELERQLADRDREIAALRSGAGDNAAFAGQLSAAQSEKDRLAAELAAARQHNEDHDRMAAELESQFAALRQRNSDLEAQLADRDKELSGLRGDLSSEMAKLKQAERGLIRALKPQIDEKHITVDLNDERLLINLASGYLFGSGEDRLKPAGADALKQVGSILKDFPEYKVHVEGHTDNRPILGALKKKFPSNKELSEARATNAAQALADGGLSGAHAMGVADTKPVMPNSTTEGRAKNRRVEISVTK
ncbi:MAG: OmpA family protein [Nitrospirae bacterium]|nr:OmpA family protein [Nitrospirota bacterium]